ncbi:MAG: cupredoxin domain-containing protein [Sphingomonas bacterium]|nr:cupredoxin domain-containing protein [Sphingomonas bacterium]
MNRLRALTLSPLLLFAMPLSLAPLAAAPPPATVVIDLSSFAFAPSVIRLRAGEPVTLRLNNSSDSVHDFTSRLFFDSASAVRGDVRRGKVTLKGRQSATVQLTPAAGTYTLTCSRFTHKMRGMSGTIIVE